MFGRTVLLLGFTLLFSILAIDIYVPMLPSMSKTFSASTQKLQTTISAFLVGMAIAQLSAAFLSDLFGMKKTMLLNIFFYLLSSLSCMHSTSINFFIVMRFLQGMTCGSIIVCAFAISRDLYEGSKLIKAMGYIVAIISLAPVIAPFLGGVIALFYSWKGVFLLLTLTSAISLTINYLYLPKLSNNRKTEGSFFLAVLALLSSKNFVVYSLLASLVYASYFSYLYNVALIYNAKFSLKINESSALIGLGATPLFLGGISVSFLIKYFSDKKMVITAFIAILISSFILLIANYNNASNMLVFFVLSMLVNLFSVSIIVSVLNSQALSSAKSYFGLASGVSGFVRYGFAFLMGVVVSMFSLNSISFIAIVFLSTSLVGVLLMSII